VARYRWMKVNRNVAKGLPKYLSSLQNLYTIIPILYTYFIRFLDNLEKRRQTKMDGLYLGLVILLFVLTGLLVKFFEKV
jgi:hypothetical protein